MNQDTGRVDFCKQYIPVLQMIEDDPDLKAVCAAHSIYKRDDKHESLIDYLYKHFMKDAYKAGIVVTDYREIVESAGMEDRVGAPSEEDLNALSAEQILGCIAWHFRRDHFDNGALISRSIAKGHMLRMLKAYFKKCDGDL